MGLAVTMRLKTNNILASVLIVILGLTDAKSIDGRIKSKKSLLSGNEAQDGLSNMLSSFVNKKKRSFHNSNSNGANPDWAEGFRVSGLIGGNFDNDAKQTSDNRILESESSVDKEEAMKKIEVLSLIEAARSAGLPWDYYLSQMYKRSSSVSTGGNELIDLADLGDFGYDDILNQPRLLDRETRDDGRRYLMWRKITG